MPEAAEALRAEEIWTCNGGAGSLIVGAKRGRVDEQDLATTEGSRGMIFGWQPTWVPIIRSLQVVWNKSHTLGCSFAKTKKIIENDP